MKEEWQMTVKIKMLKLAKICLTLFFYQNFGTNILLL